MHSRHLLAPLTLTLALLLTAAAVCAQETPELLQNPGFDLDANNDTLPDSWSCDLGRIGYQEVAYLSKNYELVSKPGAYVLATQPLTLKPGQQYTLTLTCRGEEGALLGALLLHGPQRPTSESPLLWNVEPTAQYEDYTASFVAPDAACCLYLYNVSRKGTIRYDKLSLREGLPDRLIIQQLSLPKIDRALGPPPVTPHLSFATPLAGGPLRAFLGVRVLRSGRETLELTERLDLDYDLVGTGIAGDEAVSETGRRAMRRLAENYYEVYVVPNRLTPVAAEQIRRRVEAGAGLIVVEGFGRVSSFMDAKSLVEAPADHALRRGLPWELLPGREILTGMQVGQLGKGHVVRLSFPLDVCRVWGLLPIENDHSTYDRRQFAYWEWWYSLLARAMVWASGREPAALLSVAAAGPGKLALQAQPCPAGATASVVYRSSRELRFDGPDLRLPAQTLRPDAAGRLQLAAPARLPAGMVFAEVTLRNAEGQALDWGSYALETPQAARLAALATDRETYRPGESVAVAASVQAVRPAEVTVQARLIDAYGRRVAEARKSCRAAAGATAVKLSLPLGAPLGVQHKVFVTVSVAGREQDSRWLAVNVPELGPKLAAADFVATTWGPGMLHPLVMDQLAEQTRRLDLNSEFCIDGHLAGEHGLLAAGYSGGGSAFREEPHSGDVRKRCLSDPAVVQAFCDEARKTAALQARSGPYAVGITDEAFLSYHNQRQELCFCPLCRARFQGWLKERYPTLEALNAEWGTSYATWEQIAGTKTEQIRGHDNAAPFVDFRTFMTDQWIEACRQITAAYHEVAPGVPMGHTNTFGVNPFNGNDYWKLATRTGFGWGQEYSEAIKASGNKAIFELWRSFVETPQARQSRAVGTSAKPFFNYGWIGYDRRAEAAIYEPWWLALHGSRGVSYFATVAMDESRGTSWCLVHPNGSLTPYSEAVRETLRDLRAGCGKLLLEYPREQPSIGILWSHPSMLTAWCESGTDEAGEPNERDGTDAYGLWNVEALNFRQHLDELQLDYEYVAPEQILGTAGEAGETPAHPVTAGEAGETPAHPVTPGEAGETPAHPATAGEAPAKAATAAKPASAGGALARYRVLILPLTVALEPGLVDKLEAYMQAGGVVVGDLRCLRTDEHGKPDAATTGMLQRVFGVKRQGKVDYGATTVTVKDSAEGLDLRGRELNLFGREGLVAAGATPLAAHASGEPALLCQQHGRGLSVYLNFALPKYDVTVRELLRQLTVRAGVSRPVTVENGRADAPPRCYERNTFARGPITVHGLIRDHRRCTDSDPVTIAFGRTAHVYDVRAGRYLGRTASTSATVAPGRTVLYALLPYRVQALSLQAPAAAPRGKPLTVRATVRADARPGDHVLHVEFTDPQGKTPWAYRWNVLAPGGVAELKLTPALSDTAGTWTVKVRDVLTGTEKQAQVKVH